jgi:hypothetical protein
VAPIDEAASEQTDQAEQADEPGTVEPRTAAPAPAAPGQPVDVGPREGPYPTLMHYQLLTPRAPLPPGAAVTMVPLPHLPNHHSPAQWAADPTERHQWRWWDGHRWTDHVADDGEAAVDPLS